MNVHGECTRGAAGEQELRTLRQAVVKKVVVERIKQPSAPVINLLGW
jgi:hypothetical protein